MSRLGRMAEITLEPEPCRECGTPTMTLICTDCREKKVLDKLGDKSEAQEKAHQEARARLRERRESFLLAKYQHMGCNVCRNTDPDVLMAAPITSAYDGPSIAIMLNRSYSEKRMSKHLKWFKVWCWNCYYKKFNPEALY